MTHTATYLLLSMLLSLGAPVLKAQKKHLYGDFSLTYFGSPKTLPNREVRSMCIDLYGIVWIGTMVGLARFDGYNTEVFRQTTNDPIRLSSNIINGLTADRTGNIWIATPNGLNVLNPALRTVQYYLQDTLKPKNICDIAIDRYGKIWISENGRLAEVMSGTDGHFTAKYIPGVEDIAGILCHADGTLWCNSFSGNKIFRVRNGILEKKYNTGLSAIKLVAFDAGDGAVSFFYQDKRWSSLEYDAVADHFTTATDSNTVLNQLHLQIEHYIRDNRALFQFETLNKSLSVLCSTPDLNGHIWVGTSNGLFVVRRNRQQFRHFAPLRGHSMRTIYEDEAGYLHFSSYSGVFRYDRAKEKWQKIKTGFPIMAYLPDGKGGMYTVGEFKIIQHLTGSKVVQSKTVLTVEGHVYAAWLMPNGQWLMDKKGLGAYDLKTNTFQHLDTSHFRGEAQTFAADSMDNIWIGTTSKGLYCYTPAARRLEKRITVNGGLSLPAAITQLLYDKGQFWIGSKGDGLYRYDPVANRITGHFTKEQGLPNNTVNALLPDGQGRLWISTDNGLSCFEPGTAGFVNFSEEDGLENTEFNTHSALRTRDGLLYFGGLNGVCAFNPDSVRRHMLVPSVFISKIVQYSGKTETLKEHYPNYSAGETVVLQPNDKFIEFHLGSTLYMDAHDNRFSYRLIPLDKKWSLQSTNPVIRYTNLPPGVYTLQIKTISTAGLESEMRSVELKVRQSFFQSWQFYSLVVLLASLLAYSLYDLRIRQIRAMYKLRRRIADDLHDDVATLLNQVVMLIKSALRSVGPDDRIRQPLGKAELSGEESLSKLGDIVWSIDEQQQSLGDLVNRLNDYAQTMFAARQIPCTHDIVLAQPRKMLNPGVRNQVLAIFKEAVNNAARHSAAGKAHYLIHNTGNILKVRIENHVTLRDFPLTSGQTGLDRMKRRAAQLKADFSVVQDGDTYVVSLTVGNIFG